jgi:hypothetical protein
VTSTHSSSASTRRNLRDDVTYTTRRCTSASLEGRVENPSPACFAFWSSSHRVPDLCDHPQSSAPDLLLLPRSSSLSAMPHLPLAHYETSKHNSPHETTNKGKTTETLWIWIQTSPCQWLITCQTKVLITWFLNLSLDESIDNKRHKIWSSNPRPNKAQLED